MTSTILRNEVAGTVCGVPGRFGTAHRWTLDAYTGKSPRNPFPGRESSFSPALFMHQTFTTEARRVRGYGAGATIRATLRLDDNCRNGRNDFSITGDVCGPRGQELAGGCLHGEIAAAFPELAHLVRWHLTGTAGPMHYPANAVYHAGDRDHRGKRAGEPYAWQQVIRFHDATGRAFPITRNVSAGFADWLRLAREDNGFESLILQSIHHPQETYSPKYTLAGPSGQFGTKWHEGPFETVRAAESFLEALNEWSPEFESVPTLFSEGKARDLDAARSCAAWPEATDAELSVGRDELTAVLLARLPELMEAFAVDMKAAGFYLDATALEESVAV